MFPASETAVDSYEMAPRRSLSVTEEVNRCRTVLTILVTLNTLWTLVAVIAVLAAIA